MLVTLECVFGPNEGLRLFRGMDELRPWFEKAQEQHGAHLHGREAKPLEPVQPQTVEAQRVCACESQLFDQLNGCAACQHAHGGAVPLAFMKDQGKGMKKGVLASLSSSYRAVSATPTVGLVGVLGSLLVCTLL